MLCPRIDIEPKKRTRESEKKSEQHNFKIANFARMSVSVVLLALLGAALALESKMLNGPPRSFARHRDRSGAFGGGGARRARALGAL